MAQVSFSKAAALSVFLLVASMAAIVSAQEMAPAPSPSLVTGAGFSVPASGAFVAVSVVVLKM
ncbi:unnamed protein product [Linum tenue]|uniref:Transmembrane protein n=1 Tax=Linum tenue TaxID=586396 RepID=A0AAV0L6W8_9ROSI|nr:unnamed protein product [Linum tenue]